MYSLGQQAAAQSCSTHTRTLPYRIYAERRCRTLTHRRGATAVKRCVSSPYDFALSLSLSLSLHLSHSSLAVCSVQCFLSQRLARFAFADVRLSSHFCRCRCLNACHSSSLIPYARRISSSLACWPPSSRRDFPLSRA